MIFFLRNENDCQMYFCSTLFLKQIIGKKRVKYLFPPGNIANNQLIKIKIEILPNELVIATKFHGNSHMFKLPKYKHYLDKQTPQLFGIWPLVHQISSVTFNHKRPLFFPTSNLWKWNAQTKIILNPSLKSMPHKPGLILSSQSINFLQLHPKKDYKL